MKRQIFTLLAVILTVGLTNGLYAQNASINTTRSNIKNNKASMDSPSACVGKIRCADGSCTISFEQDVVSPRDAASGLPTGKRMHKPFVITKELDRSSPAPTRESPTKGSSGKVSVSDINIILNVKGKSRSLPVVNGQFNMPNDCDDQDCDLVVSWSWGETNSGSRPTRYEATFNLAVENGEYMASKKEYVGHVTLIKQ